MQEYLNSTRPNYTFSAYKVAGNGMSDEDRRNLFSVLDVSNQGKNTYTRLSGLKFQQGETYYVWVIGKETFIFIKWVFK